MVKSLQCVHRILITIAWWLMARVASTTNFWIRNNSLTKWVNSSFQRELRRCKYFSIIIPKTKWRFELTWYASICGKKQSDDNVIAFKNRKSTIEYCSYYYFFIVAFLFFSWNVPRRHCANPIGVCNEQQLHRKGLRLATTSS